VQVDLYDGSSVINDEEGTANSFTIDPTSLGTSFVPQNGVFRLPEPAPAIVKLRIHQTTAITNTHSFFIDELTLQPMTQLYTGGPYASMHIGATAFSTDDTWTITVVNDYGGEVQNAFWRLFDMPTLGHVLRSINDGSETMADTIIA